MPIICKKCKAVLPDNFKFCPSCGYSLCEVKKTYKRREKGSGSVVKMSGNRTKPWAAKLNGKLLGYFPSRASAERYLMDNHTGDPSMLVLTVEQIYKRVTQSQAFQGLADGSQKNIEYSWKRFTSLKSKKMRDIKTTDLQGVVDAANEDGCGRDGCAKIKSLASMLCQNAMLDDIIIRDYSEGIELPERVELVKRRNFTFDEILTLLYNDSDRVARIVLTMIYSAVRLGELFGVKKTDVFLAGDKPYMIGGEKTEAGKNRIIPIKSEILPYIVGFMQEPGEYLICTKTGKKMHESNFRNKDFYPLLDRLKFDYKDENGHNVLTPHRTRHTYISESIAAGVKPEILKLVVGHANYNTGVNTYGKETRLEVMQQEVKKSF